MADQSGVYVRPYNWTNDAAQGLDIDQTKMDADGNQVAAALNNRIYADGSASNVTADIPMSGHGFTGLRDGVNPGDSATARQVNAVAAAGAFAFCLSVLGL